MKEKKVNFTFGESAGPGVPVKKPVEKKEIVPAKTTAIVKVSNSKATKAPAVRGKKVPKVSFVIQYGDKSASYESIVDNAMKAWKADAGKKSELKSIEIYAKPEDGKAYYVVNGTDTGSVEL